LCAGKAAEQILHPELPCLGAVHDHVEAEAFARVAVASQPAVAALVAYCEAEATALIKANIDIANALVVALIEQGTLGSEIDAIISATMTTRSIETEHRRRDEWKRREVSAAAFKPESVIKIG
jgi:hypothetical protein